MLLEPQSDESEANVTEEELAEVGERFRRLCRLPLRPLRAEVELEDEQGMARDKTRKLELMRLRVHAELMFGGRFVWVPSLTLTCDCRQLIFSYVAGPLNQSEAQTLAVPTALWQ